MPDKKTDYIKESHLICALLFFFVRNSFADLCFKRWLLFSQIIEIFNQ